MYSKGAADRRLWMVVYSKGAIQAAVVEAAKTLGYSEVREHQRLVLRNFLVGKMCPISLSFSRKSCSSLLNDSSNLINFSIERTHGTLHKKASAGNKVPVFTGKSGTSLFQYAPRTACH